jgi:hypothetical protein
MRAVSFRLPTSWVVGLVVSLAACAAPPDAPTVPDFARGSSGPSVTATDPSEATRDTTLDVAVLGSGFDAGSRVEFLLAGDADPKLRTDSTRYVSSRELVATVTIDADAAIGFRDVAVTTSTGKKGIGSERFSVVLEEALVTSTVADADPSVAPTLQIRSDSLGAYQHSNALVSMIQAIGAWVLDSYNPNNAARRLYLEFSRPIAGSGPNGGSPVAVPSGLYYARVIARCNLYGNAMQALGLGGTMACPLHIRFAYGGSDYAVQMNPQSGDADGSYAETNPATVTCVAASSSGGLCAGWRLTPSGTNAGSSANVAKLIKYATSKGKTTKLNQGDFYFSFSIGVTDP